MIKLAVFLSLILGFYAQGKSRDVSLLIQQRGVLESDISLLLLSNQGSFYPVQVARNTNSSEIINLLIDKKFLPGEFILRFDYVLDPESSPYPSEKRIFISTQDLEMMVNPVYLNNPDSTWFQSGEKENTAFSGFQNENEEFRGKLAVLQAFLMNYDDTESRLYKQAITEYESRRKEYNNWIELKKRNDHDLFVSKSYSFQYIPKIEWKDSEEDRIKSLIENYFEGADFDKPLITGFSSFKEWMDAYVNLYGTMVFTSELQDSLFTLAGKTAIELAGEGHPKVFGWMVDYFYNGYNLLNIEPGIRLLQKYIIDPNCLAARKEEIEKRLKGIEELMTGSYPKNIVATSSDGSQFDLFAFESEKKYLVLLFWSVDCIHCSAEIEKLFSFNQETKSNKLFDVIAISVDETPHDINGWQQKLDGLAEWIHLGPLSDNSLNVAEDYNIPFVPYLMVLNPRTKKILALPENTEDLARYITID